jgi:hypothetical protein
MIPGGSAARTWKLSRVCSRRLSLCLNAHIARGKSARSQLLLRFPAHFYQGVDEIIHGLVLLRLAPHPYERVDQIVNRFALLLRHAAC